MDASSGSLKDRRMLVVESDRDVREVVCEALEMFGAKPETAANLHEAVLGLRATRFDAVVADAEFWREGLALAVDRTRPGTAVVLTGPCAGLGALPPHVVLLGKPFSLASLARALEQALDRTEER